MTEEQEQKIKSVLKQNTNYNSNEIDYYYYFLKTNKITPLVDKISDDQIVKGKYYLEFDGYINNVASYLLDFYEKNELIQLPENVKTIVDNSNILLQKLESQTPFNIVDNGKLYSFDFEVNQIFSCDLSKINIPKNILGRELTNEENAYLLSGGEVLFKNLIDKKNKTFDSIVVLDAFKKGLRFNTIVDADTILRNNSTIYSSYTPQNVNPIPTTISRLKSTPKIAQMSALVPSSNNAQLYEVMELATQFYIKSYQADNNKAKSFAEIKHIDVQTAEKFKLGFASDDWNSFYNHGLAKGFSAEIMEEAGLIKIIDDKVHAGKKFIYDVFRDRLIFPILNSKSCTVGFGGRDLTEQEDAIKYLNSKENAIYKKHDNLFGLEPSSITSIVQNNETYLCEGYTDAISMHQAGITNTLACCGTALTEHQIELISKYCDTLVLCFDGDKAGRMATDRAIKIGLEKDMNVVVVVLVNNEDPNSFFVKNGPEELYKYIQENRFDFLEYKYNQIENQRNFFEISDTILDLLDSISLIKSKERANEALLKMSDLFHVEPLILENNLKEIKVKKELAQLKKKAPVHKNEIVYNRKIG